MTGGSETETHNQLNLRIKKKTKNRRKNLFKREQCQLKMTAMKNQTTKRKNSKTVPENLSRLAILKFIHNYYFCQHRGCNEISLYDLNAMTKNKKFRHNWLFNPSYAYCTHSKLWNLVYIDGQGMFCALCREFEGKQNNNGLKQWNCAPNVRYRTDSVQAHLSNKMHKESVQAHKRRSTSYFNAEETSKINHLKTMCISKYSNPSFGSQRRKLPLPNAFLIFN